MARKRKAEAEPLFECSICRCVPMPNNAAHIARHRSGGKHKRLEELVEKKDLLEAWGIKLMEGTKIKYVCISCDLEMQMSFKKMEQHFKVTHQQTSNIPTLEVFKKPESEDIPISCTEEKLRAEGPRTDAAKQVDEAGGKQGVHEESDEEHHSGDVSKLPCDERPCHTCGARGVAVNKNQLTFSGFF